MAWSMDEIVQKKRKPERMVEKPGDKQAAILKAFGYKVVDGVLQRISR
jgi:hypothetical protein